MRRLDKINRPSTCKRKCDCEECEGAEAQTTARKASDKARNRPD